MVLPQCMRTLCDLVEVNPVMYDLQEQISDYELNGEVIATLVILVLVVMLAWAGNILVMVVIVKSRVLHSGFNGFIASLALCDLLFSTSLAVTIMHRSIPKLWYFSDDLCKVMNTLPIFFSYVSVSHVMLISIERYCIISAQEPRETSIKISTIFIIAAWIWNGIIILPVNVYNYGVGYENINNVTWLRPTCVDTSGTNIISIYMFAVAGPVGYILPVVVASVCYYKISRIVRRVRGRMRATITVQINQRQEKMVKLFVIIVVLLIVTWLPVYILELSRFTNLWVPRWLGDYVGYFLMINTVCNPALYGCYHSQIRQEYLRLLSQCGKCSCCKVAAITPENVLRAKQIRIHTIR